MIKVGITGQSGFIGSHIFNSLSLKKDIYELITFDDEYFNSKEMLLEFTAKCDCIIHLAALNRHNESQKIYDANMELVEKLISALNDSKSKAHIIFASSIQEIKNNSYGNSKKEGREKLASWAKKHGNGFTGLIIPNVFGPFGKPFHNSVISTFSYQLLYGEKPTIEVNAELKLIYIKELINKIEYKIGDALGFFEETLNVDPSYSLSVIDILNKLEKFKKYYYEEGIIPNLESPFDLNLFNTFRSYVDLKSHFPVKYKVHRDYRGDFVEILKIHSGGQIAFSTTNPGITRGNHFHTRKIERFAIIEGEALIQLRRIGTSAIYDFCLSGDCPSFIDIPIWYTHNIKNIGNQNLVMVFWTNEFYNVNDSDTYLEGV